MAKASAKKKSPATATPKEKKEKKSKAVVKLTAREKAQRNLKVVTPLVVIYTLAASYYTGTLSGKWIWFSWHPLGMMAAVIAIGLPSVLLKKIGGLENIRMHANLMFLGACSMSAAFYVIYSNKDMFGKEHFLTTHSWLGCVVSIGWVSTSIVNFGLLHPDYASLSTRRNLTLRSGHKMAGRAAFFLAWATCFTGFQTLQADPMYQAVFALPLVAFSVFIFI
mmetsp:Transcript_15967/g.18928  ORF Transcript_15967/g.18928 Transcript_15967/m.18928 type:complete len:222 (+) Transcript_15967:168-833(+)